MECKWKILVFKNWCCFYENGFGRFIGFSYRWKMFIMCEGYLNVGIIIILVIYDWKKVINCCFWKFIYNLNWFLIIGLGLVLI